MSLVQLEPRIDASALEGELRKQLEGEVRFDAISRALYSTDASVYKIRPLGVVIPKTREDIVRMVEICGRFRCPITMRGGGTSQAGQAIGEGIQVDTSKYYNRLLEVNAEERWARVEPGIVLDELNAQTGSAGAALRAGYFHRQPRDHRRHDGQQFLRRAQRALRQDHRSRAGADGAAFRRQHRAFSRDAAQRSAGGRYARSGVLSRGAGARPRTRG